MMTCKNTISLDEENIIDLYVNKRMSVAKIAKVLNIGTSPIYKRLKKLNLTRNAVDCCAGRTYAITKGKNIYLCPCGKKVERYQSQTKGNVYCSVKCSNLYNNNNNFSEKSFRFDINKYEYFEPLKGIGDYSLLNLSKYKIAHINRNKFNHYFYSNGIDDDCKAYVYGLLITDGTIAKRGDNYFTRLSLSDKDIVYKVADKFKFTNEIKYTNYGKSSMYTFTMFGGILAHDLKLLGCGCNKTENANYPLINRDLDSHFIRGVLDGDGSWSTRKRDNYTCELKFFGNDKLLYGIYLKIKEHLNIEPSALEYPIDYDSNYKMESYAVMKYSTTKSRIIRDFLYKDANIYMQRKYDIAFKNA